MEGPNFRIVGNISEEEKAQERERLVGQLYDKHLSEMSDKEKERLNMLEYPKTDVEVQSIDFANSVINDWMEKSGVKSYDIPERNIHILPQDLYKDAGFRSGANAVALYPKQAIAMNASKVRHGKIPFAQIVFHEMLHLKGHLTLEVKKNKNDGDTEEETVRSVFRDGVGVHPNMKEKKLGNNYEYFVGLHEAIIASAEKDFYELLIKQDFVADEVKRFDDDEYKRIISKFAKKENVTEDEIFWISENGGNVNLFPYKYFRDVYDYVIDQIYSEHSDEYKDRVEVKEEFLRSHFTGHLLGIAKLVERTFGEGSFRVLGMMKDNDTSIQVMDTLKGFRRRFLKDK